MPRRSSSLSDASTEAGSAQPLYRRVMQTLKQEIVSGVYPVDTQLPPEGVLCERFQVSRHTIRDALRELREAGLVASRQGAGTTVLRSGAPRAYVQEVASIDDLIEVANATKYDVSASGMVTADRTLAERLGGAAGQKWFRTEGFRYAPEDGRPVCWTEVYVHGDFAGVARLIGRRSGPIYRWIEDLYGESVAQVVQSLRGRDAPAAVAATLGLSTRAPVMEVQRVYRLSSGVVAEVAVNLYPVDRFDLTMTLRRAKA